MSEGATASLTFYARDAAGRLSSTTIPRGAYASGYGTTTGLLSTASTPDHVTMSYAYDGSLVTSATSSGAISGSVQYGYDNNFRTTSASVNGVSPVTLTYDADSLLTGTGALAITRSAANGLVTLSSVGSVSEARTYDGFGAPATTDAKFGATRSSGSSTTATRSIALRRGGRSRRRPQMSLPTSTSRCSKGTFPGATSHET